MADNIDGLSMQTLLAQIVDQAGTAEGVTDVFHLLANLAFTQYGEAVFKNKNIKRLSTLPKQAHPLAATASAGNHTAGTGMSKKKDTGLTGLARKAPTVVLLLNRRSKLAYIPEKKPTVLRLIHENLVSRCDYHEAVRAESDGQMPAVIFTGRHKSGSRFNFDPTADGLPNNRFYSDPTADGLHATLHDIYAVDGPPGGAPYRLETALKTFVRWNPDLFPELTDHKYSRTTPGPYTSTFDVLRAVDGLAELPTEPERWADYCVHLFDMVKQRVVTTVRFRTGRNAHKR